MRIKFSSFLPVLALLALACAGEKAQSPAPAPKPAIATAAPTAAPTASVVRDYPPTRRGETVEKLHGTELADPYRWLEDGSSPEVKDWLKAQGDYARKTLDALSERTELVKRFHELYYVERMQAPVKRGARYFWEKKEK